VPGKRALIVTDPGVTSLGIVDRLKRILQARKTEVTVFDKVEPDPSGETVWSIYSLARDFKPDLFIGLGGGSSMDAGKGGWALYENPDLAGMSIAEVKQELPSRQLHKKAKYVAIPTTSGTGSEVTRVAVITDHNFDPHLKIAWVSVEMVPDVAIIDPELASSMPPSVTANTGFDALVHAVESYVLSDPSDIVDSLDIGAAKLVLEWLPEAVANGANMRAREKMHVAALEAGMAFGNGALWVVHVTAHELGSSFRMPHGLTCALMLVPSLAFLYPSHKARLVKLASELGIGGGDDKARVNNLLDSIDEFKLKVQIPVSIKAAGLEESVYQGRIQQIIDRSVEQTNGRVASAPGLFPVTEEQVRELFAHAWNGTRAELK